MTRFFYNIIVRGYGLAIRAASLRNAKAAKWVSGRRGWRSMLIEQRAKLSSAEVIWVHCASYGEFEQGRPLIEGLKKKYPLSSVVLTFFSPSGYDAFNDWAGADIVCYLPLDTRANAKDFIAIIKPRMAVFIKYEFWVNYLRQLAENQVRTYLVSAVFKPHHPFFRWYGGIFRESLRVFHHLFLQDERSAELLRSIGITNCTVTGDTRFDRVMEIRGEGKPLQELMRFKGGDKLIICGSTWPKDDSAVIEAFTRLQVNNVKMVIAPHEVDEIAITMLGAKLARAGIPHSRYSTGVNADSRVLVLDTMGMLSRSYRYADCAYVGGGFDSGIHNILEPAVYGIPVTFGGGDHHKFNEAVELIAMGAADAVKDATALRQVWVRHITDSAYRAKTAAQLESYFRKNSGSVEKVLQLIEMPVG